MKLPNGYGSVVKLSGKRRARSLSVSPTSKKHRTASSDGIRSILHISKSGNLPCSTSQSITTAALSRNI